MHAYKNTHKKSNTQTYTPLITGVASCNYMDFTTLSPPKANININAIKK